MTTSDARALARRRFVDAARVTGRIVRWQVSVAALVVFALVMWQSDTGSDVERTLISACVAATLSSLLIDSAAVMLAASPTSMRRRFAHRVVWIFPAAAGWIIAQWIFITDPRRLLPPRWAWIELTTLLAVVLATELTAARRTRATGLTGVAALVCFVAAVALLSRRISLLPTSEHELRFASLGAIAVALCLFASREPALKLNRWRRSPRQTEKEGPISEGKCKSAQVGSSAQWPQP